MGATADVVPIRLYGLNYNTRRGPDWASDDLRCKTRQQIWTDLKLLQKLTNRIRLLSLIDCNQGELVLDVAKELGMQVWLGLWVSSDENIFRQEVSTFEDMLSKGLIDPGLVLGVTVGSEVLLREEATVEQMLGYVLRVRRVLRTYGRNSLPVSITEVGIYYRKHQLLRDNVDALYLNLFPYFSWPDNDRILGAVDRLIGEARTIMNSSKGGARLVLGETGWPAGGGKPEKEGLASPEHQMQYFMEFYCRVHLSLGWEYYYFTGIDNAWRKEQGSPSIEGTWGFFNADLTLKSHFKDLVFDCGGDTQFSFAATDWTIPLPPESCRAHKACEGIGGNCCPTDYGCCENSPTTSLPPTPPPTFPPTNKPTTLAPTFNPTPPPITSAPTVNPTPGSSNQPTDDLHRGSENTPQPSKRPTLLPTTSPRGVGATCTLHEDCAKLGLQGVCCPTLSGVFLRCCSPQSPTMSLPTSSPPVPPPTVNPTTRSPTTPWPTFYPAVEPSNQPTFSDESGNMPVPTLFNSGGGTQQPNNKQPIFVPTTAQPPAVAASCTVHKDCANVGLQGLCCPTLDGVFLRCCSTTTTAEATTSTPVETATQPDLSSPSTSQPANGKIISFSSVEPPSTIPLPKRSTPTIPAAAVVGPVPTNNYPSTPSSANRPSSSCCRCYCTWWSMVVAFLLTIATSFWVTS
eukprot:scaffold7696_cov141-Cylindrotheca_fusiformis.AAC.13